MARPPNEPEPSPANGASANKPRENASRPYKQLKAASCQNIYKIGILSCN